MHVGQREIEWAKRHLYTACRQRQPEVRRHLFIGVGLEEEALRAAVTQAEVNREARIKRDVCPANLETEGIEPEIDPLWPERSARRARESEVDDKFVGNANEAVAAEIGVPVWRVVVHRHATDRKGERRGKARSEAADF